MNSTGDIWLFQNRHGNCKYYDRGHCNFLKSTYDIEDPPCPSIVKLTKVIPERLKTNMFFVQRNFILTCFVMVARQPYNQQHYSTGL